MEVLRGRTSFAVEIASSPVFVRDRSSVLPTLNTPPVATEESVDATWNCLNSSFESGKGPEEDDCRSDSSSSIGDPDDDTDDEEVQSKSSGGFSSLGSLEESLPVKRGLSNHFSGKSKSFVNLAEANSVEDIEKPENPFNKRRRILIASKWTRRRSSFYCWPNPKSMPLLALKEEDYGEEQEESRVLFSSEDDEDEEEKLKGKTFADFHRRRLMSFKSRSCFSLADLQRRHEHEEQEDQ